MQVLVVHYQKVAVADCPTGMVWRNRERVIRVCFKGTHVSSDFALRER